MDCNLNFVADCIYCEYTINNRKKYKASDYSRTGSDEVELKINWVYHLMEYFRQSMIAV